MLGQLILVFGGVAVAIMALAAAVVLGVRARVPLAVELLRRFSRLFNPRQMRTAGSPGSSTSVVMHVGRTSGRSYATPVDVIAAGDGFVIALPYGTRSNWVRNVLASGTATIRRNGGTYAVDHPELVPLEAVAACFPPSNLRGLRLFGVEHCLRLQRVDAAHDAEAA